MTLAIPPTHTFQPVPVLDPGRVPGLPRTAQYELVPPESGHLLVHVEITPSPEVPLGYIDGRPYGSFKVCDTLTGGWWARYDSDGRLAACAPLGAHGLRYTTRVFGYPATVDPRRSWEIRFAPEDDAGTRMFSVVVVITCPHCKAAIPWDQWHKEDAAGELLRCPSCDWHDLSADLLA